MRVCLVKVLAVNVKLVRRKSLLVRMEESFELVARTAQRSLLSTISKSLSRMVSSFHRQ